jgi:twitching motility protein PilJ
VLALLTVLALGVMGYAALESYLDLRPDGHPAGAGAPPVALAERAARIAAQAAEGEAGAFDRLRQLRGSLPTLAPENGTKPSDLPPGQEEPGAGSTVGPALFDALGRSVGKVLAGEAAMLEARQRHDELTGLRSQLSSAVDGLALAMVDLGADRWGIYQASRQLWLGERLVDTARSLFRGPGDPVAGAGAVERDLAEFAQVLEGLLIGDAGRDLPPLEHPANVARLAEVAEVFTEVNARVSALLNLVPASVAVRSATQELGVLADRLAASRPGVGEGVAQGGWDLPRLGPLGRLGQFGPLAQLTPMELLAVGAGAVALLSGLLALLTWGVGVRRQGAGAVERNREQQRAIDRLLLDLEEVAAGDLTVRTHGWGTFAAPVAAALNGTLESLGRKLTLVRKAATGLATVREQSPGEAAREAQGAGGAERPGGARDMVGAVETVRGLIESLVTSSQEAAALAADVRRLQDGAAQDLGAVRRHLTALRSERARLETETAAAARLAELPEAIGVVTELLHEVTDQAQILALNTSIQVAQAGDGGREFAPIADEMRRMAERIGHAARRVIALLAGLEAGVETAARAPQTGAAATDTASAGEAADEALTHVDTAWQELARGVAALAERLAARSARASEAAGGLESLLRAGVQVTATAVPADLSHSVAKLERALGQFKLPA